MTRETYLDVLDALATAWTVRIIAVPSLPWYMYARDVVEAYAPALV